MEADRQICICVCEEEEKGSIISKKVILYDELNSTAHLIYQRNEKGSEMCSMCVNRMEKASKTPGGVWNCVGIVRLALMQNQ